MKLTDAYFGITLLNPNSPKPPELQIMNLFQSLRVLRSVAVYKTRKEELEKDLYKDREFDPLHFCFGDTQGRHEYEMLVKGAFDKDWRLYDIYKMYIEPNRDYLLELVDKISVQSCEDWLKEEDERYKQYTKEENDT